MSLLHLVVVVVAIISPIFAGLTISIEPTGQVNWKTTVTITCSDSDGDVASDGYDVLSDSVSLYQSNSDYSFDLDRVTSNSGIDGKFQVIISDVMATDDGAAFKCSANRKGQSDAVTMSVLEPPLAPENVAAVPTYEEATVTFDAADGATYYTVEYQADGEADFTMANESLTLTEVTLTELLVATTYTVKVTALNAAGSRDVASTATFTTLDNRTPLIAESVILSKEWTDAYTKVAISLTWETANSASSSIPITKTKITMARNGETEVIEKDGDIKTYTFESMDPSTKYEFTVSLINDNGEGPAANGDMDVPAPTTKPPTKAPTEPPVVIVTSAPVKLSCDSVQGYTIAGTNGSAAIEPPKYGDEVLLACSAQNGNGTEIEWTYEGIPYPSENMPGPVVAGIKSTITVIADENYQGIYECNIVGEPNKCSYTVISPEVGKVEIAAAGSLPSYLFLITALIILYIH